MTTNSDNPRTIYNRSQQFAIMEKELTSIGQELQAVNETRLANITFYMAGLATAMKILYQENISSITITK